MDKQEFFDLPTNKATVEKLMNLSIQYFDEDNPLWVFYNEVASNLKSYLYLPKKVKEVVDKRTTKSIYESYKKMKEMGYRKELVLPF